MKTSQLLLTALLGLGLSSVACAQTTAPGAPGTAGVPGAASTPVVPGSTGAVVPGQPSTALPGTLSPVGTAPSTIYSPGTVPADASGTLRANQPIGSTPGTTPARSTRRTMPGARTNNTPVRP